MKLQLSTALLLIFLVACASPSKTVVHSPISERLSRYKHIDLTVTASGESMSKYTESLRLAILAQLKELRLFQFASNSDITANSGRLKVVVTITEVNTVGSFSRLMIGALAGQDYAISEVEIIDSKSTQKLGSARIDSRLEYRGAYISNSASTSLVRLSQQIVGFLQQNM